MYVFPPSRKRNDNHAAPETSNGPKGCDLFPLHLFKVKVKNVELKFNRNQPQVSLPGFTTIQKEQGNRRKSYMVIYESHRKYHRSLW